MGLFLNTQITTVIIGHNEDSQCPLHKGLIFHFMAVTQHLQPSVLTLAVIFLEDNRTNRNIEKIPVTGLDFIALLIRIL
jgi:hypothetical protein